MPKPRWRLIRAISETRLWNITTGELSSFMEATAAIAVQPDFAEVPVKPINLTVDYLRPGMKGPLTAHATVTRKGSRIASVRVLSWQASPEKSVAEGLYHFLLV